MTDRAADWVSEPARRVPVLARPDVLVVGAGSAGIAAAVASARRGASTLLIEGGGWIGGLATFGLINLLLTLDDGAGRQVVAGLCQEMVDRLASTGDASYPSAEVWNSEEPAVVGEWRGWGLVWGAPPEAVRYSVAFDPERFVDVSADLLEMAGARLRLATWFAGVVMADRRIEAVLVESKSGRQAIVPSVVIDTTGDADVAAACGNRYEHVTIPPYSWYRAGGVDPDGDLGPAAFRTTARGRVLVPFGPAADRVDPCDPDDMTRALFAGRAAARAHFEQLRATQPAFAHAWLDDHARMLGITESRRITGDYVLTKEDGDAHFDDAVARTGHWTRRGVVFEIPYRCLKWAPVANLLVAGRCISTTRYVHQATKEIPAAMATGEASGVAAAVVARAGPVADVHAIDVAALRRDLASAGADVGTVSIE